MSVVAKRLDGLRCDLVWRFSLAQATLCSMGTQLPPEKEQMSGCIKMPLGTEVGISPGNFVVDGDRPPPLPKKGRILQFSAHIYCGQTAAWIKMSLGIEIGLGLRDTVLDGDPAPPKRGTPRDSAPPSFQPMSIVAKRLDAARCHLVWKLASAQGILC